MKIVQKQSNALWNKTIQMLDGVHTGYSIFPRTTLLRNPMRRNPQKSTLWWHRKNLPVLQTCRCFAVLFHNGCKRTEQAHLYRDHTPTTRFNRKCNSIAGFLIPIPHVGEIKFRGLDARVLQSNYVALYNVSFLQLVLTYCRAPSRLPYFIATVNIQLILKNCLYQIKKAEIPLLGEAFLILCYKCNGTAGLTLLLTQRLFQVRTAAFDTCLPFLRCYMCVRSLWSHYLRLNWLKLVT